MPFSVRPIKVTPSFPAAAEAVGNGGIRVKLVDTDNFHGLSYRLIVGTHHQTMLNSVEGSNCCCGAHTDSASKVVPRLQRSYLLLSIGPF